MKHGFVSMSESRLPARRLGTHANSDLFHADMHCYLLPIADRLLVIRVGWRS